MRIWLALGVILLVILACLLGGGSDPLTRAVEVNLEVVALAQSAQALGCPATVTQNGNVFGFVCIRGTGHSLDVRMERFASDVDALAAFHAVRGDHPLQDYHGWPAYAWVYDENPDNPWLPLRHRIHVWVAERWLITCHAFDDTVYAIAPDPATASEAVYHAARDVGLFAARIQAYLPVAVNLHARVPDLVVTGMRIELETGGSCDYSSTNLGARVWVRNVGSAGAGPFVVDVNGRRGGVDGLTAGASASLWFSGGYVWPGENHAFADADFQVAESDESNNGFSGIVPMPTLPPTCTPTPTATLTPAPTATPTRPPRQ